MSASELAASALALFVAAALTLAGSAAQADTAQNSGDCVVIIQGNDNSAKVNGCGKLPTYPPEPPGYHVWATPDLGLGFVQDGHWVPIVPNGSGSVLMVTLHPGPFQIWAPEDHWSSSGEDMPALQISIFGGPSLLGLASAELFAPATGMADSVRGSGRLFAFDASDLASREGGLGHNYIVGGRFNLRMPHWRGLFVSLIGVGSSTEDNLIAPDGRVYMVFLMQEDPAGFRGGKARIEDAPRDNIELRFTANPRS